MAERGLYQVWTSKRKYAHWNSKWGIDTWKHCSATLMETLCDAYYEEDESD